MAIQNRIIEEQNILLDTPEAMYDFMVFIHNPSIATSGIINNPVFFNTNFYDLENIDNSKTVSYLYLLNTNLKDIFGTSISTNHSLTPQPSPLNMLHKICIWGNEIIEVELDSTNPVDIIIESQIDTIVHSFIKFKIVYRGLYGTAISKHYAGEMIREVTDISSLINSVNIKNQSNAIQSNLFSPNVSTNIIEIFDSFANWSPYSSTKIYKSKNNALYFFECKNNYSLLQSTGFISGIDIDYINKSIKLETQDKYKFFIDKKMDKNITYKNISIKDIFTDLISPYFFTYKTNNRIKYTVYTQYIESLLPKVKYINTSEFATYGDLFKEICTSTGTRIFFNEKEELLIDNDIFTNNLNTSLKTIDDTSDIVTITGNYNPELIINKVVSKSNTRSPLWDSNMFKFNTNLIPLNDSETFTTDGGYWTMTKDGGNPSPFTYSGGSMTSETNNTLIDILLTLSKTGILTSIDTYIVNMRILINPFSTGVKPQTTTNLIAIENPFLKTTYQEYVFEITGTNDFSISIPLSPTQHISINKIQIIKKENTRTMGMIAKQEYTWTYNQESLPVDDSLVSCVKKVESFALLTKGMDANNYGFNSVVEIDILATTLKYFKINYNDLVVATNGYYQFYGKVIDISYDLNVNEISERDSVKIIIGFGADINYEDYTDTYGGYISYLVTQGFNTVKSFELYFSVDQLPILYQYAKEINGKTYRNSIRYPILPKNTLVPVLAPSDINVYEFYVKFATPENQNFNYAGFVEDLDQYLGEFIGEFNGISSLETICALGELSIYDDESYNTKHKTLISMQLDKVKSHTTDQIVKYDYGFAGDLYPYDDLILKVEKTKPSENDSDLKITITNNHEVSVIDTPIISMLSSLYLEIDSTTYGNIYAGCVLLMKPVVETNDFYSLYTSIKKNKYTILQKEIKNSKYYILIDKVFPTERNSLNQHPNIIIYTSEIFHLNYFSIRGNPIVETKENVSMIEQKSIDEFKESVNEVNGSVTDIKFIETMGNYLLNETSVISASSIEPNIDKTKYTVKVDNIKRFDLDVLDRVIVYENQYLMINSPEPIDIADEKPFIITEKSISISNGNSIESLVMVNTLPTKSYLNTYSINKSEINLWKPLSINTPTNYLEIEQIKLDKVINDEILVGVSKSTKYAYCQLKDGVITGNNVSAKLTQNTNVDFDPIIVIKRNEKVLLKIGKEYVVAISIYNIGLSKTQYENFINHGISYSTIVKYAANDSVNFIILQRNFKTDKNTIIQDITSPLPATCDVIELSTFNPVISTDDNPIASCSSNLDFNGALDTREEYVGETLPTIVNWTDCGITISWLGGVGANVNGTTIKMGVVANGTPTTSTYDSFNGQFTLNGSFTTGSSNLSTVGNIQYALRNATGKNEWAKYILISGTPIPILTNLVSPTVLSGVTGIGKNPFYNKNITEIKLLKKDSNFTNYTSGGMGINEVSSNIIHVAYSSFLTNFSRIVFHESEISGIVNETTYYVETIDYSHFKVLYWYNSNIIPISISGTNFGLYSILTPEYSFLTTPYNINKISATNGISTTIYVPSELTLSNIEISNVRLQGYLTADTPTNIVCLGGEFANVVFNNCSFLHIKMSELFTSDYFQINKCLFESNYKITISNIINSTDINIKYTHAGTNSLLNKSKNVFNINIQQPKNCVDSLINLDGSTLFNLCENLNVITINANVSHIFTSCSNISNISLKFKEYLTSTMPSNMDGVFINCRNIKNIYIPNSILVALLFVGCNNIVNLSIDSFFTRIYFGFNCNMIKDCVIDMTHTAFTYNTDPLFYNSNLIIGNQIKVDLSTQTMNFANDCTAVSGNYVYGGLTPYTSANFANGTITQDFGNTWN